MNYANKILGAKTIETLQNNGVKAILDKRFSSIDSYIKFIVSIQNVRTSCARNIERYLKSWFSIHSLK